MDKRAGMAHTAAVSTVHASYAMDVPGLSGDGRQVSGADRRPLEVDHTKLWPQYMVQGSWSAWRFAGLADHRSMLKAPFMASSGQIKYECWLPVGVTLRLLEECQKHDLKGKC